jgi:uncharacterized protein YybS (DUF2232 family)
MNADTTLLKSGRSMMYEMPTIMTILATCQTYVGILLAFTILAKAGLTLTGVSSYSM